MVKIRKLARPVGAAAFALGMAVATVVPASAADNIQKFGVQETINDYATGAPLIGYTVQNLSPSSDPVPHNGQLYEATMTVDAINGWQMPMIGLFNARAENSQLYRLIPNAPGTISGASVPPGGSTTGKLYFDVVGAVPNSVVYNDGIRDILVWVP
jgi:Domain of unknown function (DUF1942)